MSNSVILVIKIFLAAIFEVLVSVTEECYVMWNVLSTRLPASPGWIGLAIMLWTNISELLSSHLGRNINCHDSFSDLSRSLLPDCTILPRVSYSVILHYIS
jgi:hypothetical protein